MTLREKLIHLRGDKTQKEVSEAIGISTSTLGMYETGERIPRDEIKKKIAKYYDVSIEYLFFE
jgi:conserved domain protein|nr:MAG TPA: helix-turn-helix domain protein [Caudoviricetes sp.]